ncbi:MAG: DNA alkylation response protein, partial [Ideonella sp.]
MDPRSDDGLNQFDELSGYNVFTTDRPLRDAVMAAGAQWAIPRLESYGAAVGSRQSFIEAEDANRHVPELSIFDQRGRRIDRVDFHPAWHAQMARYRNAGWISLPFRDDRPGRWVADMAGLYLQCQVESGSTCPSTMTWASIAVLQREAGLWTLLRDRLLSDEYDPRDLPIEQKRSIYIGMGMTEKQ